MERTRQVWPGDAEEVHAERVKREKAENERALKQRAEQQHAAADAPQPAPTEE